MFIEERQWTRENDYEYWLKIPIHKFNLEHNKSNYLYGLLGKGLRVIPHELRITDDYIIFIADKPYNCQVYTKLRSEQHWSKESVFKIYCNDNLYELPLEILKQMRGYLNNIIDNKEELK